MDILNDAQVCSNQSRGWQFCGQVITILGFWIILTLLQLLNSAVVAPEQVQTMSKQMGVAASQENRQFGLWIIFCKTLPALE